MWIIPKNLDVYRYVRDMEGLSLDFEELSLLCERSLMWRSKPSLVRTWLQRWKRVSWMQHLFGRILRPSMDDHFAEKWTSLLPVIPVSRSVSQGKEKEQTTPDTFGRILNESLKQLDLFGSLEKMSVDTLPLDSPQFIEAYEIWVTQLRQNCLQRQNVELHTGESGCLSWRTPQHDGEGGIKDYETYGKMKNPKLKLRDQVNWPTPAHRDYKGKSGAGFVKRHRKTGVATLPDALGLLDQDSPNTNGKSRELWMTPETKNQQGYQVMNGKQYPRLGKQAKGKLNPDWVEQLMGLPIGWTDCDY